jgi:hypothetical protein
VFEIESDIPFASNRGGRGRKPTAFPFADMEEGDSFLIPCDIKDKKAVESWRRKLLVAKKRFNAARSEDYQFKSATEAGGIRVWRTA